MFERNDVNDVVHHDFVAAYVPTSHVYFGNIGDGWGYGEHHKSKISQDLEKWRLGASPRSRSMPRSLPSTALEEITEDREDGQAGRHAEEEGLATMRAWHDGAGKAWKDAKDAKDADMIWLDVGWDELRVENISWRGHSCWEKPPPARQPAGCGQIYTVKATVKPFGHEPCHRFECTVFSLMLPAPTGRWCRKKRLSHIRNERHFMSPDGLSLMTLIPYNQTLASLYWLCSSEFFGENQTTSNTPFLCIMSNMHQFFL